MSLSTTKAHLTQILSDSENKVVALSGKWGTGKSHLWQEVKSSSADDRIKGALYVSLFGLASIDQVKLKIVQSAIPKAEEHPSWWDRAQRSWRVASKVLESFHKGFSALNDIAMLAVPSILKDRMIVLDDIERKHNNLSADEVMGFIDEFTQQHGARFILILNTDQLSDRKLWDTFREKVIDQEVRLETTPAEAFEIAQTLVPSPYVDRIKKTVEICGLTNIRIICKVIRAINRILGKRNDLSDDILVRVIPSTVLLAAIYYKGIDDGPDFDFVLDVGNPRANRDWGKKPDELDEAGKRRARWRLQLQELGIYSCDEYEEIVVEFLKSGLFDVAEVTKIIDRYAGEAEIMKTKTLVHHFNEHVVWHHWLSESELLVEAQQLAERANHLDAYNVTWLYEVISGLADGVSIADAMVTNWIEAYRAKAGEVENFDDLHFARRSIHPRIQTEFDAANAASQAKATVYDACEYLAKNQSWRHKDEAIMKSATVQDFEVTIKSLNAESLKLFMCRFLDMCVHRENYQQYFGNATDNFIAACRNLLADPNPGRLGGLIMMLFKDAKLENELNPPITATPAAAVGMSSPDSPSSV